MIDLVRIEMFKFRTQRAQMVILVVGLSLTILSFGLLVAATRVEEAAQLRLDSVAMQRQLLTGTGTSVVVLILAILGMTSEFRHGTISSSLRGVPNRPRLVMAKGVTYALIALAYGIIAAILNQIGARTVLGIEGVDVVVSNGTIIKGVAKSLGGLVLFAGLGVGVASIVANQVAAILIVLLEPFAASIAAAVLPKIGRYLPSQAAEAFMAGDSLHPLSLSEWTAGLVFVCYVVAALVAGSVLLSRRDIG